MNPINQICMHIGTHTVNGCADKDPNAELDGEYTAKK